MQDSTKEIKIVKKFSLGRLISRILQSIGAVVVLFVVLAIVVFFNGHFFLGKAYEFLINIEQPQKADVIVVLSGAEYKQRVEHGVELFKQGYAGKMIMTGEGSDEPEMSCPEKMKMLAVSAGVSNEDIILEEQAKTTSENARYSLALMQSYGFKSAVVVTSDYHTRRTGILFGDVFENSGISFVVTGERKDISKTENWWLDDLEVQKVANEYMKFIWYYFF